MTELVDYAERMTRAAIRELPDGVYDFLDHIDDDGIDVGRPIPLKVTITKSGRRDRGRLDRHLAAGQGRDQQHAQLHEIGELLRASARSCRRTSRPTRACSARSRSPRREGTIANMVLPGACAARGLTGFRMVDCMFGALAKMLPDQVFAGLRRRQYRRVDRRLVRATARPFIYVDFTCCAWGARPYADGLDGNSHIYANMASQPIEVTETEQPLQITAYEFIQDAMGPGKFRGGAPFRREYRFLAEEAILQVRSDRRDFRPFGLYGGGPGKPSMNYLNPEREPGAAAVEADDDDAKGRSVPPRGRRRRRLGRPAGARPGAGAADVLNDFVSAARGARGLRRRADRRPARGGRGGDNSLARGDAGAARRPARSGLRLGHGARGGVESRPMKIAPDLVIFDCDGVLVDSEPIFNRAHADILSQCGYRITPESVGDRFCGISDAEMLAAIEREWGRRLPADYRERVAAMTDASCAAELTTFPGIREALDRIPARICVASSSTPGRIRKSLAIVGLLDRFEPNIFSAVMVARGNRAPIFSCSRRGK